MDDILKEYFIPDYILLPKSDITKVSHVPSCPVIVFINSKSGGQLGGELQMTYRLLLNKNQVVDLGEKAPDQVLQQLYFNLEKHKQKGDNLSSAIQKKLRLIVAGGDGTASWLLGVVSDLKLAQPPPIATVPLGTGNNLSFSFGWGKKNPGTDTQSVKAFLNQVRNGREMKIDSWHILMRMKAPKQGSCDPIAPLELPHSLHAFHRVSVSDTLNTDGFHTFRGGFWNYFSMGMDAKVSFAFHTERKLHPEKFKNQLVNQKYCAADKSEGHEKIKSVGRPPRTSQRDLTPPYVDDGLIEVVGFRDAWHGLVLLAPNGHGTRLAQANRIRFEFHKGAAEHTFMRIDGEPWKQPLPADDDTFVVEISHFRQVSILATPHCPSKSIYAPPSPYIPKETDCNSNEEEFEEDWEERKKLGAADGYDMSRLG